MLGVISQASEPNNTNLVASTNLVAIGGGVRIEIGGAFP